MTRLHETPECTGIWVLGFEDGMGLAMATCTRCDDKTYDIGEAASENRVNATLWELHEKGYRLRYTNPPSRIGQF